MNVQFGLTPILTIRETEEIGVHVTASVHATWWLPLERCQPVTDAVRPRVGEYIGGLLDALQAAIDEARADLAAGPVEIHFQSGMVEHGDGFRLTMPPHDR